MKLLVRLFSRKFSRLSLDAFPRNVIKSPPKKNEKAKLDVNLSKQKDEIQHFNSKFNTRIMEKKADDTIKLADWSFSIPYVINEIEKSRLAWFMFEDFGLIQKFSIENEVLSNFINDVKHGYSVYKNSFHNYDHAVTGKFVFASILITLSYACNILYTKILWISGELFRFDQSWYANCQLLS